MNVRYVSNGGTHYNNPLTGCGVRPVIKISSLTFAEGEGNLENPYREKSTTINTSNIKVGEYMSIPTSGNDCGEDKRCLFRVVSKQNNAIKVILNGLLPSKSLFDVNRNVTYTSGNIIDTVVTTFANTIDNKYRYLGNDTTFGIGTYGDSANYKVVQETKYIGTVGLPVVGEMFTGNDIDMGSTKPFVNVNTTENPTVTNVYWTMNARNDSYVHNVYENSLLGIYDIPLTGCGVRPVLFLNNNLTFASGEGTAENPFILE